MSNLLCFRKNKGFTQREMAEKIGISESYYAMIELQLRNPSYNFIKKFVEAFPGSNMELFFLNNNFTERD